MRCGIIGGREINPRPIASIIQYLTETCGILPATIVNYSLYRQPQESSKIFNYGTPIYYIKHTF
jgi:hypothetical protein